MLGCNIFADKKCQVFSGERKSIKIGDDSIGKSNIKQESTEVQDEEK